MVKGIKIQEYKQTLEETNKIVDILISTVSELEERINKLEKKQLLSNHPKRFG